MKNKKAKMIIYILLVILFIIIMVFLVNTFIIRSKVVKCELNKNNSENKYEQVANYTIYTKKGIVTKVDMKETISSKNTTIVKYLTNQMKNNYESEKNKYKGYELKINEGREKSEFNVNIDYSKLNINDYAKAYNIKTTNNKVTLENIKDYYQMMGADCK